MRLDYSNIAQYYDKVRITSPDYLRFWSSRIAHYGSVKKHSRVLDIGCGTGRFTLMLAKNTGAEVYAIDPSDDMMGEAKKKDKKKKVRWSKGTAERLSFPNEYFDCVFMTFVFHQIKNRKKSLTEIYRVLKPKGKCVFMTTSYAHIKRSPLYMFPGLAAIDLARFPSLPEFKRILEKGGFSNVHYHLDKYKDHGYAVDDYLKRVKSKHISTLSVLSKEEFERGYEEFKRRLKEKYQDYIKIPHGVYIVSGEK
jgi:ubiquinone/menaquinone biosynthesis C-methylase UbiE